jgi:hypothetical protein
MPRVRNHAKLMCHLSFGILELTFDQILIVVPQPDPDESGQDNDKVSPIAVGNAP